MSNEKNATPDVAHIVANPTEYGFDWFTDKVSKGDRTWSVPLVKHLDVDLLRLTFGDGFWIASADGTSRHVTNQRIARDIKDDKPLATDLTIKTAIVENMLGMKSKRRTVVETIVYKYGGVKYATLEEMQEAARVDLGNQGFPETMIEHFVNRLAGETEPVK